MLVGITTAIDRATWLERDPTPPGRADPADSLKEHKRAADVGRGSPLRALLPRDPRQTRSPVYICV